MTREETIEAIKVMQAYVDGKEIKAIFTDGRLAGKVTWSWGGNHLSYSIKEEPQPFSIGDLVYSSYHEAEGTIEEKDEERLAVRFGNNLYYYYSTGKIYPIGIADLQKVKQETKPFEWRGKNIQWVKHNNYDAALKVVYLSDVGIGMTNLYTNDKEELNAPEVWPWEKAKAWFEWSEDNATWRKFE